MFFAPETEGFYHGVLGTNEHFLVGGDQVVMKISSELDSTGRWKYEDVGSVPPQLADKVRVFALEVIAIMKRVASKQLKASGERA